MSFHRALLANLQRDGTWLATGTDHQITLTKKFGTRIVEFILEKHGDGLYTIVPTGYEFASSISHWDYLNGERRLARNKTIIASFIRTLKTVKMWEYITNKEFVRVNTNNKKSNKKKVGSELTELFRDESPKLMNGLRTQE